MEKNKPKFNIGQKVFTIRDKKLVEDIITGVFMCMEKGRLGTYTDNYKVSNAKFIKFVYSFEVDDDVPKYSWVNEEYIFETKEELIKSL